MKKHLLFLLILVCGNLALASDEVKVLNAWVRPAAAGKATAAYMQIVNDKGMDVELVEVESSAAMMNEIHKTVLENGVSQMVRINTLLIPASSTVMLKPQGIHIMLMGLKQNLKVGETISLLLVFKDGTNISLTVPVKNG
jgi:copper(I)-binding protein